MRPSDPGTDETRTHNYPDVMVFLPPECFSKCSHQAVGSFPIFLGSIGVHTLDDPSINILF